MNIKEKHQQLYSQIPSFKCKANCTDCCGPVPISSYEAKQLGIPGQHLTPTKPGTLKCIFASKTGCTVYDKRPMMCRLFGTTKHPLLTCFHGCRPKNQLTKTKARKLITQHYKLIAKQS